MAELPDLGERCSWPLCGQLDFLPLVCDHCSAVFCRLHHAPDSHQCRAVPQGKQADPDNQRTINFSCHVDKCSAVQSVHIECDQCHKSVCIAHRHPDSHNCTAIVQQHSSDANTTQRQPVVGKPLIITPPDQLSPLAARIQLMRAKKRACCAPNQHVAVDDRVYVLVTPPSGESADYRAVYVSRRWSLGRALDVIAEVCAVSNKSSGGRLVLARARDAVRLDSLAGFSVNVSELQEKGWLCDGELLRLEYQH